MRRSTKPPDDVDPPLAPPSEPPPEEGLSDLEKDDQEPEVVSKPLSEPLMFKALLSYLFVLSRLQCCTIHTLVIYSFGF